MIFTDRKNAAYHFGAFDIGFILATPIGFPYSGVEVFEMWTMGWEL